MYSFSVVPICLLIAILSCTAQEIEIDQIQTEKGTNLLDDNALETGEVHIPYKLVGRLAITLKNNVKTPIPCTVDLPFQCNKELSISADGKYYLYYQSVSELYVPATSHTFLGYDFIFDPETTQAGGNNDVPSPIDF